MSEALRFVLVVEALGLAALPLTRVVFNRLPGGGAGLAKALGLLLVTWLAWLAGSLVPYGLVVVLLAVGLVLAVGLLLRFWPFAEQPEDPERRRLLWWGEGVFLVAFAAMALVRAFAPDIVGTEQPMDMALIATVDRGGGFPPENPWFAGDDLDYYYLGHLAVAILIKLAGTGVDEGYNLALPTIYAITASAVFGAGAALGAVAGRAPVRCGVAAAVVVLVLGNLRSAELLRDAAELRAFEWFQASRVIPDTINEFPAFSFVLGDLHAHVLALPFKALLLAWALQLLVAGPRPRDALAAGITCGLLYAINAWSAPVLAGVLLLALVARRPDPAAAAAWAGTFALAALLAVLPFLASFDPPTGGIGIVDDRRAFGAFVADQWRIHGLLLWLAAAAFAGVTLRARHGLRNLAWLLVALAAVGSALSGFDLAGALVLCALVAVALVQVARRATAPAERAVWLLLATGLGCVLVPELVYVRDEFEGTGMDRMNTVFKLYYEAWLLLGVAAAGTLALARDWLGRHGALAWGGVAAVLAALSLSFTVAGPYARTDAFAEGPRLDGLGWLRESAPGDVTAIAWLRANAGRQDVVLESAGDDYSAFGHGRISTFTGIPSVVNWPGHVLQWGQDPGNRRADVDELYRTTDPTRARLLARRYGVTYVVVGPLERTDHGDAPAAKWDALGRRVHEDRGTVVWRLTG